MADQEVHERYSDRKKRSQRVDLTAIEQSMFHGDTKRMEDLMKEYRNIQKEKRTEIAIDQSALKPVNEHKNRYPDVLPFRETAVRLEPIEGVDGSEYINANFVSDISADQKQTQKYICSQAPLVHTFNDFWRMVWEQHAPLIVMITNLVEGNKIKADTYWPTKVGQTLRYGFLTVKLMREYHRGHSVVIRSFHIWKTPPAQPAVSSAPSSGNSSAKGATAGSGSSDDESPRDISGSADENDFDSGYNTGDDHFSFSDSSSESDLEPIEGQEVRKVTQLHCTKWPDFGVPESAQVMKDLIYELELRKRRPEDAIIVHCSAGIGRTGTFVAIHIALQQDLQGKLIDVRQIVRNLRFQRIGSGSSFAGFVDVGMVQSKEQYIFLHGVVSEMLRDREQLLNIRSKRFKRFSFNPQTARDSLSSNKAASMYLPSSRKEASVSMSPYQQRGESVNQHLILSQSSHFGPLSRQKESMFHEKIIDHTLSASGMVNISSGSSTASKTNPSTLHTSTNSLLAKSSSQIPSPGREKDFLVPRVKAADSANRPRGNSLPGLGLRRSRSDESLRGSKEDNISLVSSGDSFRTPPSFAKIRSPRSKDSAPNITVISPRHVTPNSPPQPSAFGSFLRNSSNDIQGTPPREGTLRTSDVAPQGTPPRDSLFGSHSKSNSNPPKLWESTEVDPKKIEEREQGLASSASALSEVTTISKSYRANLRMASDSITITPPTSSPALDTKQ